MPGRLVGGVSVSASNAAPSVRQGLRVRNAVAGIPEIVDMRRGGV
jgi:hypothetical protein